MDSDENTIYEGNFLDDKYHGKGTLYNQNINFFNEEFPYEDFGYLNGRWLRYEGMFSKDLKNGKGILFLSNGERFYGNFEQDYVNGPGTFYVNNGKIVHGVWKNDKFIDPS